MTAARTRFFCAAVPCADTRARAFRAWLMSLIGYLRCFGRANVFDDIRWRRLPLIFVIGLLYPPPRGKNCRRVGPPPYGDNVTGGRGDATLANELERRAIARLVEQADELGVGDQVPQEVRAYACGDGPSYSGGLLWQRAHPDFEDTGCCWGSILKGPEHCTCWTPVFAQEQAEPIVPRSPEDVTVRPRMCGDCAFRPDSPEQADEFMREQLLMLPEEGAPFWCHDGMRRPLHWVHPDGRRVDGDPDNWIPATVGRVPFRADGRPALLCAGWAARTRRAGRLGQLEEA